MPRAANDFMAAATQLFAGIAATPEAAALLAQYGYAAPALAAEQAHITAFRTALHAQQTAMALARRATQTQQQAFRTLGRWIAQFRMVATVAFSDDPTLLVALSIPQRGRRVNRKDAEGAKTGEIKNEEAESVEPVAEGEMRTQTVERDQAMPKREMRTGEDDLTPPIQQQE